MTEDTKNYPKVLIVNSQSMYKNNATGITLISLFGSWPGDRIMELYQWKPLKSTGESIAIKSSQIPPKAIPIHYIVRKLMGLDCVYENELNVTSPTIQAKTKDSFKKAIASTVKLLSEFTPICFYKKNSLKEIDEFAPDVIYTMSTSVYINRVAVFFSKRYNIKIVIHYMDNWRETAFLNNRYTKWLNCLLNKTVSKLEKRMNKGLTISEKMAFEYTVKYRADYTALMNCVDIPECETTVTYKEKDHVIFTYAGGLHLGRFEQLLKVQDEIAKFNSASKGPVVSFVIYTSDNYKSEYINSFNKSITEFKAFLPHEQVHNIYDEADVLIHIESFDKDIIEYTKYSISTKIPEYMASGKPILCFSPRNIAVSEYINDMQTGICASNADELFDAVEVLAAKAEMRRYFGLNGIETARTNHSKAAALAKLIDVLKYNI